jgi:hypothetical protein
VANPHYQKEKIMGINKYIVFALAFAFSQTVLASGTSNEAGTETTSVNAKGIDDWGFGLGIGIEQYRTMPYIEQASTYGTNRIVVIEKDYRTLPSAWLTLNWNIFPLPQNEENLKAAGTSNEVQKVKWGLFSGVKILDSNSQTFSAFALGPQVSFITAQKQYSVGFGWVTHRTRSLATGIQEGQPLPTQFTDIKYKDSTENSYIVMFSVGL